MRVRKKYSDRIVLAFILLGLLLFAIFTSLVLVNNKVLTDKVYFESVFDNATGLSRNPPIYFKGLEIGRVDEFELDFETNDIQVRFYVYTEYADKIVRYAVISRMGNLLLGTGNEYEILLPQRPLVGEFEPLAEGELVPFITSELGRSYATRGNIQVKFDGVDGILTGVTEVLTNLRRITDPDSGEITVVLKQAELIANSLLATASQLEKAKLGSETAGMINNLDDTISHAEEVVTDIEIVAAKADNFFTKADEVAALSIELADTANTGVVTATEAFNQANTAIKQIQQVALEADLLIASMEDSLNRTNQVLEAYRDPAAIIDQVSDDKIPATIDRVDANLVYLEAILKEIYLQREQLAQAIVSMNRTLGSFDKTLQGVNNNPLFKDGIPVEPGTDDGIEIQ